MTDNSSSDMPFDLTAALEGLGGRMSILRDLARLFLQERQGMVDAVQRALQQEQNSEVERAVHSLRGAIGYLRSGPLGRVTEQMQEAATQARMDEVRQLMPRFEQAVESLAVALDEFLKTPWQPRNASDGP